MSNKTEHKMPEGIHATCTPATGLSRKMWEAALYGEPGSLKRMAKAFAKEDKKKNSKS